MSENKTMTVIAVIVALVVMFMTAAIAVSVYYGGERSQQVRLSCIENGGIPGVGREAPPCYYGKEGTAS